MSLKLYTHPANFHAFPALIAAAYNGVRLDVPKFDPATDASTPEFLAKSPLGKSPLLDTEQGSVFEPNAIARYIARLRRDTDLLGSTFFESGQVDQWLDFSTNELEAPRHIVLHLSHDAAAYNSAKADIMTALKVLNNWLATRQFLVGNKVTLADIVLVSALVELFRHSIAPAARAEIVNVTRWFDTCVNQPEFRHVLGDVQLAAKEVKGDHGTAKAAETKPFQAAAASATPAPAPAAKKDDDSFSFDDDDEDDGAAAALIAKKKEEEEKKKKEGAKAAPVGKSTVVLDVSPMEAETDLDELEKAIRSTVVMEGLVWGASDRIPVAYGVKKIRILSTIVDDLVSVDDMQEQIEALDGCQSTTIFSFNKV